MLSADQETSASEKKNLKSFASFLHFILVKVLRDNDPQARCMIPMEHKGYDLMITVQRIPKPPLTPSEPFVTLSQESLEKGITHPPDIEGIICEKKTDI